MHAPASPSSLRAKFPEPDEDAFRAWFPGLRRTSTEFVDPEANGKFIFISSTRAIALTSCYVYLTGKPRFRVIAWPNAGNAEDMYTNDSNVNQRLPTSPLLDWCRKNGAEMLAVQLPGRANRLREVNFFLLPYGQLE